MTPFTHLFGCWVISPSHCFPWLVETSSCLPLHLAKNNSLSTTPLSNSKCIFLLLHTHTCTPQLPDKPPTCDTIKLSSLILSSVSLEVVFFILSKIKYSSVFWPQSRVPLKIGCYILSWIGGAQQGTFTKSMWPGLPGLTVTQSEQLYVVTLFKLSPSLYSYPFWKKAVGYPCCFFFLVFSSSFSYMCYLGQQFLTTKSNEYFSIFILPSSYLKLQTILFLNFL